MQGHNGKSMTAGVDVSNLM